ncbi:hypothetical protein ABT061_41295 [Streptosporangium sp. NPDC002544]|uniref:hypothetical protein n=1 Tax=Streptosporangium sp. NPDC002544 TaxID=3154538 RepID=UPI00332D4E9D
MGIRDFFLARRLRRGPTLFLPYVPDPEVVLETVRLLNPRAFAWGKASILAGESVSLKGPIEATPDLEARVGLPRPWRIAYVASSSATRGGQEYEPRHVVEGLARRLHGYAHPGMPHPSGSAAYAYRCVPIPDQRVIDLLAEVLPGLEAPPDPDDPCGEFTSPTGPLEISVIRWPNYTDYSVSDQGIELSPGLLELAERVAVILAEEGDGIACDHTFFPLQPGKVSPVLLSDPAP